MDGGRGVCEVCDVVEAGKGWNVSGADVPILVLVVTRLEGLTLSGLSNEVRDAIEFDLVLVILDDGDSWSKKSRGILLRLLNELLLEPSFSFGGL